MASALASQLAQGASLNAALLAAGRRKNPDSYLFTGRDTAAHDLDSIHALGVAGFTQLRAIAPLTFDPFEDPLFSGAVKDLDRTLMPREEIDLLDKNVAAFLRALGPYVMEAPAGKALEWLVRRFRINEFSVDDVLTTFIPYNDTPHFTKMLSILHIQPQSKWSFLLAFKGAVKPVPRTALVTEMLKTHDVARVLVDLLPAALRDATVHRTLVAFHTSLLLEFIARSKNISPDTAALLVPALHEPLRDDLKAPISKDGVLSSYVLLAAMSQKCTLSASAIKVTLGAMVRGAARVQTAQFVASAVAFCSPQEELDAVPDSVAKGFLRLADAQDALKTAFGYSGGKKFVCPLLRTISSRLTDTTATTFIDTVLATPTTPAYASRCIAATLMQRSLTVKDPAAVLALQQLLGHTYQRHPAAFAAAAEALASQTDETRRAVEQLALKLSTASIEGSGSGAQRLAASALVASTSADAHARAGAVREILARLRSTEVTEGEKASLHASLCARVADPSPAVLDALYAEPQTVMPVLADPTFPYLATVAAALATADGARALLKTHLRFVAHHYFTTPTSSEGVEMRAVKDDAVLALETLVWPALLFSKPHHKTAAAVWAILADPRAEGLVGATGLLAGCAEAVRAREREGAEQRSAEEMAAVNAAVAAKVAGNIVASDTFATGVAFVASRMRDANAHARGLAYLVARALLARLSGEHQIDAAQRFVEAMDLHVSVSVDSDALAAGEDTEATAMSEVELAALLVPKPNSPSTLRRLQLSILCLVPSISRPYNVQLDWLRHSAEAGADTRGHRYVQLMRTVYRAANSAAAPSGLSTAIIHALFISLGQDALVYLAGVWTAPASELSADQNQDPALATIALKHAFAFLRAQPTGAAATPVDFQTVLPALLLATVSKDARVRLAAVECIGVLASMTSAKKASAVYAFDAFYGSTSGHLQYLDWSDFGKYLAIVAQHREHLKNDAGYLAILHQEHLAKAPGDSKKTVGFKQRIICYLLSHVNSCTDIHAKIVLLRTVEHVSDSVKLQMLLPAVQAYALPFAKGEGDQADSEDRVALVPLLLAVFDTSAAKDLNDADGEAWPLYIDLVEAAFATSTSSVARSVLAARLERSLFDKLSRDRQVDISLALLASGTQDADSGQRCKELLGKVILDVPLITHLLVVLRPSSLTSERSPKRPRTNIEKADADTLPSMTLYAELLASQALPSSLELVASLLETLGLVTQRVSSAATNLSYIQQLLMTACSSAASGITTANTGMVRLDVLVEIIRAGDNPRTVSQALLLIASLARLTPESVLHNVMPVFTFMGSNVFHRDDSYTFQVVQNTIDSIVPVLVTSLRSRHEQPLDLYIAASEFMHIFTDAANHIPRHRRTKFFTHLVDVLGPEDFLAPVCMLLADKTGGKQARQNASEGFSLPLAVFTRYGPDIQASTIREILMEIGRLTSIIEAPEDAGKAFFVPSSTRNEDRLHPLLRRRVQTLLAFVGSAMKGSSIALKRDATTSIVVSEIISLLIAHISKSPSTKAAESIDIASSARRALNDALTSVAAADFIQAVASILQSEETTAQLGALAAVAERMDLVSLDTRQNLSQPMMAIINSIRGLIMHTNNPVLVVAALEALRIISLGDISGEEGALAEAFPNVLEALKHQELVGGSLATLPAMTKKLGPRVLPYFQGLIDACVRVLRDPRQDTIAHGHSAEVLQTLLTSIPAFWGTVELSKVIRLYLEHGSSSTDLTEILSNIVKAATKNVSSAIVVPTLASIWPELNSTSHPTVIAKHMRFFDVLKRALRIAPRAVVGEHTRVLFNTFIEAFGLERNETEERLKLVISAFLQVVVKLNDAAFRPLFRRLYDWAFVTGIDDVPGREARQITFCRVYLALLDMFKALMTPYMSVIMSGAVDTMKSFIEDDPINATLWINVIRTFTNSLVFDDGGFWRDDKLTTLAAPLIAQIPVCIEADIREGKEELIRCLVALFEAANDDTLLKKANLDVLMHTRAEDAQIRLLSLQCADKIWEKHTGKLMGFVSETTTFIAECAEDDNDSVVKEARRLKATIEAVAGALEI